MKKIISKKKNIKGYIFVFITAGIMFSTVVVSAATTWLSTNVTYDNSESGMSAVNVQDAIDELYSSMSKAPAMSETAQQLVEKVVETGDGLYADPVEDDRYVYRGADPDNYIWLDIDGDGTKEDCTEMYRIVAVEADNTLKVISDHSLEEDCGMGYRTFPFDPGYENSISGVTDAWSTEGTRFTSVSTDYCGYTTNSSSFCGCNVWGSRTTMLDSKGNNITQMPREQGGKDMYTLPEKEAYINTHLNTVFLNTINSELQEKIVDHVFNVGHAREDAMYLSATVVQEKKYKWIGKIGLIAPSDYIKASTNEDCIGASYYNSNSYCYSNGTTHNYLYPSSSMVFITPGHNYLGRIIWIMYTDGNIGGNLGDPRDSHRVFPTFFLSSDITLSGSGTSSDPYTIKN